ncbi:diguanylate cyclase [Paenibacillus jamilae]|uniref:Diguanylate cyclase n=2 Tax=Paenibacillus TaxID=44249 RepID=A0ACC4ZV98_9BACL|nr:MULTISPECIES: GGDEF domain-containing protein [Paenibacillus]AJE51310.1 diguanylate cyclase [Paenibacillus polymyxa]AUO06086.1 GGDEF domain-containing protein [Paenibacillus sp. lzh-N1]AZH27721.1 GGDEF domain-containing protein [Paenibacillus sp. M-152]KTS81956.1 diguanylate cyclase [Paenibacillus jamilae]
MSISLTALLLIGLTLALWIYTLIFLHSVMMERNLLRKLAYQDPVTGLFNRNALELFWKRSNGKEAFAIMYLDLDGFKAINDTYGHQIGDKLLRRVSDHLLQVTNSHQKAFRIGGDEFLLIMKDYDADQVTVLAELLLQKISVPYNIQGINLQVTGSIGITMHPSPKKPLPSLLKEADIAMYQAKGMGRNRYAVYQRIKQRPNVRSYGTARVIKFAAGFRKKTKIQSIQQMAAL